MVFVLTLSLYVNYHWPLSWDVYIHINYALTYMNHGITTIDPLLNAPNGKAIGYVPLFHILLIIVSKITFLNLFDTAKLFQIIVPLCTTGVIMYIANKFYDELTAFMAGLLLISSFIFTRMYLPIPEPASIVLFIIGIYLFYEATLYDKGSYACLTAIVSMLIIALHFSTFVYFMILITILMVVQLYLQKNLNALKSYIYMLGVLVLIGVCSIFALYMISPTHTSDIISGILTIFNEPMSLFMGQKAMGLERYIKCLGIFPLIFGVIGLFYSFKYREMLFVSAWALVAFIISNLHWFGIPVYTYRMLIYVLIPAVIIGGYGISKIIQKLNTKNKLYSVILILAIIIVTCFSGISNLEDPSVTHSYSTTEVSTYQTAPPTSSEQEVINWFKNVENKDDSILSNNMFFATIISSADEMPIHYKFNKFIANPENTSKKLVDKEKIGYVLYDKSLIMNNTTEYDDLSVVAVNGSFYPTYYFTQQINNQNFNEIQLPYSEKVFENDRFIICKIT